MPWQRILFLTVPGPPGDSFGGFFAFIDGFANLFGDLHPANSELGEDGFTTFLEMIGLDIGSGTTGVINSVESETLVLPYQDEFIGIED